MRAALRSQPEPHDVDVTIESKSAGTITLTGIVVSSAEKRATEQVAAAVPGVTAVDNQLHVMATSHLFTSSKN